MKSHRQMKFACYKGTSWISKAIRWITRSEYSHVAVILRDTSVIEAWDSGVRIVRNLSEQHSPGTIVDVYSFMTPLTAEQCKAAEDFLRDQIGKHYDWKSVLRFVTKRKSKRDDHWFCSELATQAAMNAGRALFASTEPWEVPPDWIPRSLALKFDYRIITDNPNRIVISP